MSLYCDHTLLHDISLRLIGARALSYAKTPTTYAKYNGNLLFIVLWFWLDFEIS